MILAQIINFAVVFFVLYKFALKPLKKLMDERSATISGGLDNAKKQEEHLTVASSTFLILSSFIIICNLLRQRQMNIKI